MSPCKRNAGPYLWPYSYWLYTCIPLKSPRKLRNKKGVSYRDIFRRVALAALTFAAPAFLSTRSQAQTIGSPPSTENSSAVDGQRVFANNCAACHGLDAHGGERAPDVVTKKEVQELADSALVRLVQDGKPGTGMPPFASLGLTQIQAVVHYLRSLQGQGMTAPLPGNPESGKILFFGKAECSRCHMAQGEGGFIGSDLSSYNGLHAAVDIRGAITDPDKNLDSRKRLVTLTTTSGQTFTGMVRNEDNFSMQLQSVDGKFHLFAKSELRSVDSQTKPLMPTDYGSRLRPQELDDLVSYLMSIVRTSDKRPIR